SSEQAVALGLERSVVDGVGLLHLSVGTVTGLRGRGELDPDRVKRDGLRMPIEDAPQILRWLVLSDQAAERPIRQHSVFSSQEAFLPSFMISSTSSARLWSSFTSTLKDSGVPGSRQFSPFTIASSMRLRPSTSSDLTVSISWPEWAPAQASGAL